MNFGSLISNKFIYKMNYHSSRFQNKTSSLNNNRFTSRPSSSIIFNHNKPSFRVQLSSSLSRTKQSTGFSNRIQPSDRYFRNVRSTSASLYSSSHKPQQGFKIQILNNNCFKRIYEGDNKNFKKQCHSIDVSSFFPQHMSNSFKFKSAKSQYLCKPLKVCKDQHKFSISCINNLSKKSEDKTTSVPLNVIIVGNRIF